MTDEIVIDITEVLVEAVNRKPKKRGTSNGNSSGSAEDRRRRKMWLLETYAADRVRVSIWDVENGADPETEPPTWTNDTYNGPGLVSLQESWGRVASWQPACRCYRCGCVLVFETLTVDRIIPGCKGGTYRRNNIRPACAPCNEKTGGALAHRPKKGRKR